MYFMGVLLIVLGGWLIDSGVEGRHPISTLEDLISKGPKNWSSVKANPTNKLGSQ